MYGICMKILIGQTFYCVSSFYVKVFRIPLFTNSVMDLVYIW